jgi:hypothetical protein
MSQNAAQGHETGLKQRHGTYVLNRRCHQSPTPSEESPCDDKTGPKQNQARGLWRGVRHDVKVISPDGDVT